MLEELKRQWQRRFPSWSPGISAPVSWAGKDSTFTNDSTHRKSGLIFHAVIYFTPKWQGAFTCDVIVTPTLEPLGDSPPQRWPDDISRLLVGVYRIGWFVAGRDIWWRLVDNCAESRRLYETMPDIDVNALGIERHPDHWYAKSYAVELTEIIREASEHFANTFEQSVVPKLHRNA